MDVLTQNARLQLNQAGGVSEALLLQRNVVIRRYAAMLKQCRTLEEGNRIHAEIVENAVDDDRFLRNTLVEMYGKYGSLDDAHAVFDAICDKNVFSWTIMIVACVQNEQGRTALQLLRRMDAEGVKPNEKTFSSIIGACSIVGDLQEGKAIHRRVADCGYEADIVVGTALINTYSSCGSVEDARAVFERLQTKDVVSCSSMIAAFGQCGHDEEALQLYREMDLEGIKCNEITCVGVLVACSGMECLAEGKLVHARVVASAFDSNVIVGNSLVTMYGKCGCIEEAWSVFDTMVRKTTASWNAMLAAYAQNGRCKEALLLHRGMDLEGIRSDEITYVTTLDACAGSGSLQQGRQIHARVVVANKLLRNPLLCNSLLDMYGKCGSLDNARRVFDELCTGNLLAWTTMISAYAQHGHCAEALELYGKMDLEGLKPNGITFINVLFACSHYGLLNEGWHYFISMREDYNISPMLEHYGCMIDLLSRAGQLDRAEDLMNSFPFQPDTRSWMTLVGACKLHGDVERGARISEKAVKMHPDYDAPYVMLSNICLATDKA